MTIPRRTFEVNPPHILVAFQREDGSCDYGARLNGSGWEMLNRHGDPLRGSAAAVMDAIRKAEDGGGALYGLPIQAPTEIKRVPNPLRPFGAPRSQQDFSVLATKMPTPEAIPQRRPLPYSPMRNFSDDWSDEQTQGHGVPVLAFIQAQDPTPGLGAVGSMYPEN